MSSLSVMFSLFLLSLSSLFGPSFYVYSPDSLCCPASPKVLQNPGCLHAHRRMRSDCGFCFCAEPYRIDGRLKHFCSEMETNNRLVCSAISSFKWLLA